LPVAGFFYELVAAQLSVHELQVAGRATCPVPDKRILVSPGVKMTAQAAPPEHVVDQAGPAFFFLCGDCGERGQGILQTEMFPGQVDRPGQGEVQRTLTVFDQFCMTPATALRHIIRMSGHGHKALMGIFFVGTPIIAMVAVGARHIMVVVKPDTAVTIGAGFDRPGGGSRPYGLADRRWLFFFTAGNGKQQGQKYEQGFTVHDLDTLP
jgi:hypothetical protein